MTGLSEVREKLKRAINILADVGRKGIWDDHPLAREAVDEIVLALALMESEQEYDPWDHRKRCDVTEDPSGIGMSCQLPKGHTCDHVWFGYAKSGDNGAAERWAILGTESENGADG